VTVELATLDLAAHGLVGRRFRFVRLVDAQRNVTFDPKYWGTDIDAVVALHTTTGE
jgi:hypothetical protein